MPRSKTAVSMSSRHDATAQRSAGWQETKSQLTREAILDAAVNCFIKYGFAATTTPRIAEMANISRGAVTHHFSSREEVILLSIEHLYRKRIASFQSLLLEATSGYELRQSDPVLVREAMEKIIRALWRYFTLPSYYAHWELLVLARTDQAMADLLDRLNNDAEGQVLQFFKQLYPFPLAEEAAVDLIFDLLFFSLRGMSVSYMRHFRRESRIEGVLEHLTGQCTALLGFSPE